LDGLIVLVLAYFFATDTHLVQHLLNEWIPPHRRPGLQMAMERLYSRLSRWIWAQVGLAIYFAVVFAIVLAAL